MSHFAELNQNNVVLRVVYVDNSELIDENGNENEQMGIDFLNFHLGSDNRWIQTSYNSNFRGHYAGIGYIYNENLDVFIAPQPYPSWILDNQTLIWNPPTLPPELTQEQLDSYCYYEWNEDQYQLDNNAGWELHCP